MTPHTKAYHTELKKATASHKRAVAAAAKHKQREKNLRKKVADAKKAALKHERAKKAALKKAATHTKAADKAKKAATTAVRKTSTASTASKPRRSRSAATDTGKKDAKGRIIWLSSTGKSEFVKTADGKRLRPAKGRKPRA